jgi:glycerol-3-phosphate acyltransferase PlsY
VSTVIGVLGTVLPAYLLGAMPWGLWVGRMKGTDIRRVGSGNLGATNVYRQLGPVPGITVLALDILKGVVAVLWGKAGLIGAGFPGGAEIAALAAGLAAIFGHVFTVFAGFRGGKGVATTIGVFLALTPKAMLIALAVWVVVTWFSKRVSAGSLALAAVYPMAIYLTERGELAPWLLLLGSVISLLIVIRHIDNIKRLARGTEPAFSLHGPASGPSAGRKEP